MFSGILATTMHLCNFLRFTTGNIVVNYTLHLQVCVWAHPYPKAGGLACHASGTHRLHAHGKDLFFFLEQIPSLVAFHISSLADDFSSFHRSGFYSISSKPVCVLFNSFQPHGFFNCSPAVDVPPGSSDADIKEAESPKAIQNGLISKL